jgi:hypothetical protein
MRYQDFLECTIPQEAPRPDPSLTIQAFEETCVVDNLFPLALESVASLYPRDAVCNVEDQENKPIGQLITCKGQPFALNVFSAPYVAAYLCEVSKDSYGLPGQFSRDYLLVRVDRLAEYKASFMASSAIWGGFYHGPTKPVLPPNAPKAAPVLIARTGIILPTELHAEAAMRSVVQPYAFERFLKLYHLLELSFDHDVVEKIRALGDDLRGIGQLLSGYESKEFDRLKQTIMDRCNDVPSIAACLEEICAEHDWHETMKKIFFDFGKSGNPLPDKWDEFQNMLLATGFTQAGAASQGFIAKGNKTVLQDKAFEKFVLHLSAYWIYRVRSSIAHSRIGEYVMRMEDEEFVEQFAERLLRRILGTVLNR